MTARLYALGSNFAGQLGIAHREDTSIPERCLFIDERCSSPFPGSGIRKVVSGGGHTICLCESGEAYAAGQAESFGQTVRSFENDGGLDNSQSCFSRVRWMEGEEIIEHFTDVAATWSASFFMTRTGDSDQVRGPGRIFAVGSGALGLGEEILQTQRPEIVARFGNGIPADPGHGERDIPEVPHDLTRIWAGVWSVVAVSSSGRELYGWGECKRGEFGDVNRKNLFLRSPTDISIDAMGGIASMNTATDVRVGRNFVVIHSHGISVNGTPTSSWRVHGKFTDDRLTAFLESLEACGVSEEGAAESLIPAVGWSNLYVLDSRSGKVMATGKNTLGEMPPDGLPPLKELSAGSAHCVGITRRGQVIAWGWTEHGNCGDTSSTSDRFSFITPAVSSAERIIGAAAGGATTFIWTSADTVLSPESSIEQNSSLQSKSPLT